MITRAQAEALLTLAESLEACERLDLVVTESDDGMRIESSGAVLLWVPAVYANSVQLRLAISKLIPKQEA